MTDWLTDRLVLFKEDTGERDWEREREREREGERERERERETERERVTKTIGWY